MLKQISEYVKIIPEVKNMAKNGESTKKTKVTDDINNEKNTIIKETITYDNTPIFNKMLICLYIIIALLASYFPDNNVSSSNFSIF